MLIFYVNEWFEELILLLLLLLLLLNLNQIMGGGALFGLCESIRLRYTPTDLQYILERYSNWDIVKSLGFQKKFVEQNVNIYCK